MSASAMQEKMPNPPRLGNKSSCFWTLPQQRKKDTAAASTKMQMEVSDDKVGPAQGKLKEMEEEQNEQLKKIDSALQSMSVCELVGAIFDAQEKQMQTHRECHK